MLLCLFGMVVPVSCTDDFGVEDFGTGDGSIAMTVSYYPNVTNEVQTRAAGNVLEDLRSLAVVVYTDAGKFVKLDERSLPALDTLSHEERPKMSDEDVKNKGSWTEGKQKRATFHLEGLPFGRYKIYCVANLPVTPDMVKLSEGEQTYESDEDKLLSYSLTWDAQTIANNDAMFGYFTIYDEKNLDMPLSRNNAETVEINKTDVKLHAWLKRAASKVTVAFDPSGLHQNVSIFIHKVTIKDIPRTCFLGKDNAPVVKFDDIDKRHEVLLEDGETIYYNAQGKEVSTDPGSGENNYQSWMELNNGQPVRGSKHEAGSQALFFFENMQGDWEHYTDPDNPDLLYPQEIYNKEPKAGWVHEYLERPEDHWDNTPWDYDTKDRIAAGTYIEVEGYYKSTNDLNTTSGPIKYRFMLGKNTTYNYNAQRNHHYKVTLKFKGWANQPEWHIDYVEEKPDLDVVDYLYVPYNYREMTTLPIRFIGDLQTLDVKILENDWAPYDFNDETKDIKLATGPGRYNDNTSGVLGGMDNAFKWNEPAWYLRNGINPELEPVEEGMKNIQKEGLGDYHLGFLALTMPLDPPANVLHHRSYSDGQPVLDSLKVIYEKGDKTKNPEWLSQDTRHFDAANLKPGEHPMAGEAAAADQSHKYTVYADGNATTVLMPVFTRAKSMIAAAGWSGNNPYEYHSRIAKLKVEAKFSRKGGKADTVLTRYVRVIQRPRITNPKAIWRKVDNTKGFKVKMMTRKSDALNANYTPFKSNGSWTAEIEKNGGENFTLEPGPNCAYAYETDEDGVEKENKNKLIGKTNTEMEFTIGFGGNAACGIIVVKYHAEKCTHRIFVRQGDEPIRISEGGATWLSKNLQHGGDGTYNYAETAPASTGGVLVDTPLSFGSYFKCGQLSQGIDESNNATYTHLLSIQKPTKAALRLSNKTDVEWDKIPCKRFGDRTSNDALRYMWRDVEVSGETYSLPTFDDFQHLTDHSEFGFGILYGDAATETQTDFEKATGYAEMWDKTTATYGMRAVVAYNKDNGNQVYFPLSISGDGRRHQAFFKETDDFTLAGRLLYGDTDYRLSNKRDRKKTANEYRPIPYNLPYSNGALYWIKQIVFDEANKKGHYEANKYFPCAAWDMNYFNFDFQAYTANCLTWMGGDTDAGKVWNTGSDALPIRLVQKHAGE